MDSPLVLTFDVGTQSARCLLVRPDGSFADLCQLKYDEPYYSKRPGWAEQRPDFYYEKICEAGRIVCERSAGRLRDVVAVTLTAIRNTPLCLDSNNKPLRDIVVWLDKRLADFDDPFPPLNKILFRIAGMRDTTKTLYQASVSNWIRQHEPEVWAKTAKFVMLPTYLNYKMTGVLLDSDANMVGHIPFDYKKRVWKKKSDLTSCIFNIESEKLCEFVKSGETLGRISREFSEKSGVPEGLPLIATGSDKGCETLGLSVVEKHKAAVSYSTTATLQMAVRKYFEPERFLPSYPGVPRDVYNPEFEIFRGFWLLSWFVREFGTQERLEAEKLGCPPEELLDRKIENIPPGCDGLLLQPFWTPGVKNPNSKGVVLGFADYHTRLHFYRAVIEGLAFELYHALRRMERRSGNRIDELYIAGGGARSDVVCRITADVFGLPVKRIQTHEASSIGASMVAFIAKGVFKDYDEAIRSMVHEKDVFRPNGEAHRIYAELYGKAYSKVFGRLQPIYKNIIKITKRRDAK